MNPGVCGLVLCGGESRRMGQDKARVRVDGLSMLEHSVRVLSQVPNRDERCEVLLSTGLEPRYPELGLECVLDELPCLRGEPDSPGLHQPTPAGPLAGLAAGLAAADSKGLEWVVVLPCDVPRMRPELLRACLDKARAENLHVCLVGQTHREGQPKASPEGAPGTHKTLAEPLIGVYSTAVLPAVRSALREGNRRLISFHRFPAGGRALEVGILSGTQANQLGWTQNVNTPADLAVALQATAGAPIDEAPGEIAGACEDGRTPGESR